MRIATITLKDGTQLHSRGNQENLERWVNDNIDNGSLGSEGEYTVVYSDYVEPEKSYQEKRKEAYLKEGLTAEVMIVALWEKVVEGRSEDSDALQVKRQAIKDKFPKQLV